MIDTASGFDSDLSRGAGASLAPLVTPDLYRKNAFRLTGLNVDAKARDLVRFADRAEMLQRLGGGVGPVTGAFGIQPPPTADDIREALQRIRDPEQRVLDEFFWFWPTCAQDTSADYALAALAEGQVARAVSSWLDSLSSPATRGAALHNLAIIEHLHAIEGAVGTIKPLGAPETCWPRAYGRWHEVLREESVWEIVGARARALEDPRISPSFARDVRSALPAALLRINVALARRAAEQGDPAGASFHAALVREARFDRHVVGVAVRRLAEPDAARVSALCDAAAASTTANVKAGGVAAKQLVERAMPLLKRVDLLLPVGDPSRVEIHDAAANAALTCVVKFANETDDWAAVVPIMESISALGGSPPVRERVATNLETAKGNLQMSTCWFCRIRPADPKAVHKVPMHGDIEREARFRGTQVRWRHHDVEVPRCATCSAAHATASTYKTLGGAIGFFAGFASCAATVDDNGLVALLLFAALTVFGTYVGKHIGRARIPAGIADVTAAQQFPAVLELRRRGWDFGNKPASTN